MEPNDLKQSTDLSSYYPSVEQTRANDAKLARAQSVAELPVIVIDAQRAAAAIPPAPSAEQVKIDDSFLAQYRALKASNPFAANSYCQRNQGPIYRAMARNPDSTLQRAVSPRRT